MDLMQVSQDEADNWKHVAIVDFTNAFSTQEVSIVFISDCLFQCALMSEKYSSLTYLNATNMVKFKFDKLILSHAQVKHLTDRLIQKFLFPSSKSEKDKIVLNIADMFNSNNNCGFNLKNFKVKYINEFFQDIISDYEKSIIGTFTKHLLLSVNQDPKLKDKYEIYFTITKFENDYGYSLVH